MKFYEIKAMELVNKQIKAAIKIFLTSLLLTLFDLHPSQRIIKCIIIKLKSLKHWLIGNFFLMISLIWLGL